MTAPQSDRKARAREDLRGIENCIFPSFDSNLEHLDEQGIRLDVRQSILHGFRSTLVAVETGLSMAESKRMLEVVVDEAKHKLHVSVTLIRDSHEENIAMAQHAAKIGADCALLGYPFNFYPQTEEELYQATKQVCESADLSFLLYPSFKFNFGRFHPSGFPLDLLERMAEIDNVVGAKLGILEPGFIHEAFSRLGDKIIIQFPWERWWPMLVAKYGLQFVGAGAYELFQSTDKPYLSNYFKLLLEGKTKEAMDIYWKLTPVRNVFEKQFMPTQMIGTYHWPQQKYYQWLVGGNGGFTRQPTMKMVQYEMEEARGVLRAIGVEPAMNDQEYYVGRTQYAKGRRNSSIAASTPAAAGSGSSSRR